MKTSVLISLLVLIIVAFCGCSLIAPQANTANLPPQIKSFTANPSSIENGKSAILSWEVANASSVKIVPGLSNAAFSGTQQVNPTRTTEYIMVAANQFGTSQSTLTLAVTEPDEPALSGLPVILSFSATPQMIAAGSKVLISWEIANAASISLEWDDTSVAMENASDSMMLRPHMPTIFTLTATNKAGYAIEQAAITIKADIADGGSAGGGSGGGGGGGGGG